MKRIVRLTESDLARIVRRVLREQNETPQQPGISTEQMLNKLVGKTVSFYLPNEFSRGVLDKVKIESFNIDNDRLIINGTQYKMGKVRLEYICGRTDDFFNLIDIDDNFIQQIISYLKNYPQAIGVLDKRKWWHNLIAYHVAKNFRQETPKEQKQMIKAKINNNLNPIVYGPPEKGSDGKLFVEVIKDAFCSEGGRTKADYASTGGNKGSGMA